MNDKKKGSRISGVSSTGRSREVERTESIGDVEKVAPTTGVKGVGKAGSVGKRRSTRTMTYAEREELFNMIDQEADKLFKGGALSEERKKVVKEAVKMAVDAGIIDEEDEEIK